MNKKYILIVIGLFATGFIVGRSCSPKPDTRHPNTTAPEVAFWTCSMHPQIQQPEAGQCPLCGMDLIPVSSDAGEELGARELKLSPAAQKLAQIEVTPAERRFVSRNVSMVGKIEYDETRLSYLTAWVPGRLDRLYVDYTGVPVREGDHMVQLYSPDLVSAQEELIQAARTVEEQSSATSDFLRKSSEKNLESAREKLSLLGLTDKQVAEIETSSSPSDHVTIFAPISGIVIHKNAVEGMYVETGTRIYTIADLSQLWLKLDAYESDLSWLRYGQSVSFETESHPGEEFTGTIAFIEPILNPKTRTVKVRVNVANTDGRLKPGMFVRATAESQLTEDGRVMNPDLAGKWISPMHPEVVKDGPGQCDVCGMDLVQAEDLGFVSEANAVAPIVVPAAAPLITGKRAVVYVASAETEGVFEGREIVLGPRAGDYYIVRSGLSEGERVVSRGSFKIDSSVQIMAKPSMMNPAGGGPAPGHAHHVDHQPTAEVVDNQVPEAFSKQMTAVVDAYFAVGSSLARDNAKKAKASAKTLLEALSEVDMSLLDAGPHDQWMPLQKKVADAADSIAANADLQSQRERFRTLSSSLTEAVKIFGADAPVYRAWCPMAFNNTGAHWLQTDEEVLNPYFGSSMLHCGEIQQQLAR